MYAVKIASDKKSAGHEINILETLTLNDRPNQKGCVRIKEAFEVSGSICIVTDLYGKNLDDVLIRQPSTHLPLSEFTSVLRQLLESVDFIHSTGIIHTDIKPANVVLAVRTVRKRGRISRDLPNDKSIRLIDFGSAVFGDGPHELEITTPPYRSPEACLGMSYSYPTDIWSLACTALELFIRKPLFDGWCNIQRLAEMEAISGPFPRHMVQEWYRNRGNEPTWV